MKYEKVFDFLETRIRVQRMKTRSKGGQEKWVSR